jgi:predicted DsbA family dithiol-disulfide isomerase
LLGRIAAECGYDAAEVTRYLSSTEDEELVREREREIRAKGVKVVPTFILAGSTVIAGAEDPTVLAAGILECLQ